MNQIAEKKYCIKSIKESLAEYGNIDQDKCHHPARVFKKYISEKLESTVYEQEAKALR